MKDGTSASSAEIPTWLWIVTLGLAVVVLAAAAHRLWKRARARRRIRLEAEERQRAIDALIELIGRAERDTAAADDLYDTSPKQSEDLLAEPKYSRQLEKYRGLRKRVSEERQRVYMERLLSQQLASFQRTGLVSAGLTLLRELNAPSHPDVASEIVAKLSIDVADVTRQVQAAIDGIASAVAASPTASDLVQFQALQRISDYQLVNTEITIPAYPANWNELVASVMDNPTLDDFIGMPSLVDRPEGWLRLKAAEALRDNNLLEAKVVLAYCNSRGYVNRGNRHGPCGDLAKAELGERTNELADLVKRLERAKYLN